MKNIQLLSSHRDDLSVNIDSENAAIQYALDYQKKNYRAVDGAMCDGKTDRGYTVRGYDDMGTHITTVFTWTIAPNGDIYDDFNGTWEYRH